MKGIKLIFFICIPVIFLGCSKNKFYDSYNDDPVNNFEIFWKDFDRYYSYFIYKRIDWDSIYNVYRPKVNDSTSEQELLNIFSDMIQVLKDGHVDLYTPIGNAGYNFYDGYAPTNNWIGIDRLGGSYLERLNRKSDKIYYGKIKDREIGYVWINSFGGNISEWSLTFPGRGLHCKPSPPPAAR